MPTALESLQAVFTAAVAGAGKTWPVRLGRSPHGQTAPQVELSGYSLANWRRSSPGPHHYGTLHVDVRLAGVSREEIETAAPAICLTAAEATWEWDDGRALAGRVTSLRIERDEASRGEQWWIGEASLEYEFERT